MGSPLWTTEWRGRFQAVDFAYPTREGVKILHNFSLHVPADTTTALAGALDAGKSTDWRCCCDSMNVLRAQCPLTVSMSRPLMRRGCGAGWPLCSKSLFYLV